MINTNSTQFVNKNSLFLFFKIYKKISKTKKNCACMIFFVDNSLPGNLLYNNGRPNRSRFVAFANFARHVAKWVFGDGTTVVAAGTTGFGSFVKFDDIIGGGGVGGRFCDPNSFDVGGIKLLGTTTGANVRKSTSSLPNNLQNKKKNILEFV